MLKLASIDELSDLLSPARFAELERLAQPDAKLPIVGSSAAADPDSLVDQYKALMIDEHKAEQAVKKAEGYRTAIKWRKGQVLIALRKRCKHGDWLKLLKTLGEIQQRADENLQIAQFYSSESAAAKVTVKQATTAMRRSGRFYNAYENCFATSQWLRVAIASEYGFPGLDVCSSHGKHFGKRWYSPEDNEAGEGACAFDGLLQIWRKHCPKNRVCWCNPPYHKSVLDQWIKKCHQEAQTGLVVVSLLPIWGLSDLVWNHAELRYPAKAVMMEGFGPKEGKSAGQGRSDVDCVVAIWRKGQTIPDTRIHPVKA